MRYCGEALWEALWETLVCTVSTVDLDLPLPLCLDVCSFDDEAVVVSTVVLEWDFWCLLFLSFLPCTELTALFSLLSMDEDTDTEAVLLV